MVQICSMEINFSEDIDQCLKVLHKGGIILYPTDTIWGLGCDATDPEAVEKIISLKQRPASKSFVVLVSAEKDILRYTASPDPAVFAYLRETEKPTTVIYGHALGLAENVLAPDGSVAIRICRDPFCKNLIKRFGKPVVSTSANASGEPPPRYFAQISGSIRSGADYCVRYRQEQITEASPSSIIRWVDGKPFYIRE